jgi:tRNA1Val (adenine37-N6)-methyltransferase
VSNTYFQFKQFIVHQEHTAMKVCTDACLFGAWLAKDENINTASTLLDIGTGTGLLSLMVAQSIAENKKSNAKITAVEIEPTAANEAKSNFNISPWSNEIELINGPIQALSQPSFDCIFTNPPFYEGDLISMSDKMNLAAHSKALPWTDLMESVSNLLNSNGYYYVLVPALRAYTMQKLAGQKGLQLMEEVVVYNAPKQKPIRAMQKFKKMEATNLAVTRTNFLIKDADNNYSAHFKQLLAPFYLHL